MHKALQADGANTLQAPQSISRVVKVASRQTAGNAQRRLRHLRNVTTMAEDKLGPGVGNPMLKRGDWEGIWSGGLQPGQMFDGSRTSPVTHSKLHNGELDVNGKTCLVPGCGRGYDVVDFAKFGASSAVGLEISPTAVARAQEYAASADLAAAAADRVHFEKADFFEYQPQGGSVDFGYDYTFLCALQPEMRQKWAETWARLVKPGGELVTLIFPIDPNREGGPPFAVSPELYKELLTPVGFESVSLEPVPPELSHERRGGMEVFGRWRRTG